MVWLQAIGGSVASLGLLTLFYIAFRRLIQQSVAVWGMRVEEGEQFEYQFTLQNLEGVPIAWKVCILLRETDFPAESGGGDKKAEIRVYSGSTRPRFVGPRAANESDGSWETRMEFARMDAFATWSIRLRSPARRVVMSLGAGELPVDRKVSRFRSVGLDLSVEEVELGFQKTVIKGPRRLPTWETGLSIVAIGPLAYGVGVWVLHLLGAVTPETVGMIEVDVAIGVLLGVAGLIWFLRIRRPVVPAIRAYRRFRTPEADLPRE